MERFTPRSREKGKIKFTGMQDEKLVLNPTHELPKILVPEPPRINLFTRRQS